jgi:hypothetical protein
VKKLPGIFAAGSLSLLLLLDVLISVTGCSLSAGRAVSPQESRTLHSNQHINEEYSKTNRKATIL